MKVELQTGPAGPRIYIRDIKAATSAVTRISINEIVSQRRSVPVVRARQIGMALARDLTPSSFPQIGRQFGNRDHTTVLHAVRRIEAERAVDPEIAQTWAAIRAALGLPDETAGALSEADVGRVLYGLTVRVATANGAEPDPAVAALVSAIADRVVERIETHATRPAAPIMAAVRATVEAAARLKRDEWSPGRRSAEAELNRNLNELRNAYEAL